MGAVEQAITRMKIIAGCGDSQISFENPQVTGYANAGAPTDHSCDVFHSDGGGPTWRKPPASVSGSFDFLYTGDHAVFGVGTSGPWLDSGWTEDNVELLVLLPIVSEAACLQNNKSLGLPADSPIDKIPDDGIPFTGAYTVGNALPDDGGNIAETGPFSGQRTGCAESMPAEYPATAGAGYFLWHVLIAR